LLLSFFLMTSSFNTEQGIPRRMPPLNENTSQLLINKRNVLTVWVNFNDEIRANNEIIPLSQLATRAKEFLENPLNNPNLPEKEIKFIDHLGEYPVSKGVISLTNDQGTSYNIYVQVQNELQRAVNELRNKAAVHCFGKNYNRLDTVFQKAIQKAVPGYISETPPFNYGKIE